MASPRARIRPACCPSAASPTSRCGSSIRGNARLERLTDLKGKRILVGPAGGGTSGLALRLLAANGITAETATLINRELPDYVDMLAKGEADAGFLVLAAEARTIQRLLRTPNVGLMSFNNADAYIQRFPFLSRLTLREGVVDFAANIPPADTTLIATTAAVLVREDAHRALVNLLAQALQEVHGQPATEGGGEVPLFQRAGEFPIANDPEFPLSEEARRVYRSGAPFLQRYVPFWLATMIDRLLVSLVVLVPILIPLVRFAPQIYNWRIRRRIMYWYGKLKSLETAGNGALSAQERAAKLSELDRIEAAVGNIPVPLGVLRPALRSAPAHRGRAPPPDRRHEPAGTPPRRGRSGTPRSSARRLGRQWAARSQGRAKSRCASPWWGRG